MQAVSLEVAPPDVEDEEPGDWRVGVCAGAPEEVGEPRGVGD